MAKTKKQMILDVIETTPRAWRMSNRRIADLVEEKYDVECSTQCVHTTLGPSRLRLQKPQSQLIKLAEKFIDRCGSVTSAKAAITYAYEKRKANDET